MGTVKTIFLIETTNKEYRIRYSGGLRPDWAHLTEKERKAILRHDSRLMRALVSCEPAFERLAEMIHTIERMKRREARKAQKCTSNKFRPLSSY